MRFIYLRMKRVLGVELFENDSMMYVYLGLNNDNPLFQSKRVRQAIAYAINKNQLLSLALKKMGKEASTPFAPSSWAYTDKVEKFTYNFAKALELLSAEGWVPGKDKILEKNGQKFEFTVLINQGNKEREKAGVIIQQQLKKIGMLSLVL